MKYTKHHLINKKLVRWSSFEFSDPTMVDRTCTLDAHTYYCLQEGKASSFSSVSNSHRSWCHTRGEQSKLPLVNIVALGMGYYEDGA